MALLAALCGFFHLPDGFRNHTLRRWLAALLDGREYTRGQMTYDLRRLRLHGMIGRIGKSHTHMVTAKGRRTALLLTKCYTRLFRTLPLEPGLPSPGSAPLLRALASVDKALEAHLQEARLAA